MIESAELQLNERISSLKQFMNHALGTNSSSDSSRRSPSSLDSSLTPSSTSTSRTTEKSATLGDTSFFNNRTMWNSTAETDGENETKSYREKNQKLMTKVMQLEDLITSYSAKLQLSNEEIRDYEHKLKLCRKELDSEVDRRRASERSLKEQMRNIQHKLEEVQAEHDVLQQKEKITSESRKTIEEINKELEKNNADKVLLISELQKDLNKKKMDINDLELTISEITNEKKHLEEDLVTERQNRDRDINEVQNEIIVLNQKSSDNIKKILKEKERERSKYDQTINHFKDQITSLEKQVESLKKKMSEIQVENSQLHSQVVSMDQREKYFTGKLNSLQDSLNEQKTQYSLLHQNHVQLLREIESNQSSEKRLQEETEGRVAQLLAKLKFAEDQNAALMHKNMNVQRNNNGLYEKLKEQNELLRANVDQLQRDKESLEKQLKQQEEEHWRHQSNEEHSRTTTDYLGRSYYSPSPFQRAERFNKPPNFVRHSNYFTPSSINMSPIESKLEDKSIGI